MKAWLGLVFAVSAIVQGSAQSAIAQPATTSATAQPTESPETLDAKAIYLRTVHAVSALPLPPYVEFTFQNGSVFQSGSDKERLRVILRVSDGHASVTSIFDSRGQPVSQLSTETVTDGRFPSTIYRLGDFPLADFGLRTGPALRPGIFEDTSTPEPDASGAPRAIASVHVLSIVYRLVDLGDDQIEGRPVYHLGMTPLTDPGHHVLRQMWVDKATFLPVRYVAERFVDAQVFKFRYLVTVNTALVDGHLVNTDADGHFDVHRVVVFHYAGEGRWSISDVSFPTSEPEAIFGPTQ